MEKVFEKDQCCKYATENGWYVRKVKAEGITGFPDRMFAKDGIVIFIEFKDPYGTYHVTKRQAVEMKKMREAGIEVFACWDWDTFLEILDRGIEQDRVEIMEQEAREISLGS